MNNFSKIIPYKDLLKIKSIKNETKKKKEESKLKTMEVSIKLPNIRTGF